LDVLDSAASLMDLTAPPGNKLEALRGQYCGCHSIRVNEQWQIVFRWDGRDARDVRLIDYH
jgi:proteic killer suppression protein